MAAIRKRLLQRLRREIALDQLTSDKIVGNVPMVLYWQNQMRKWGVPGDVAWDDPRAYKEATLTHG